MRTVLDAGFDRQIVRNLSIKQKQSSIADAALEFVTLFISESHVVFTNLKLVKEVSSAQAWLSSLCRRVTSSCHRLQAYMSCSFREMLHSRIELEHVGLFFRGVGRVGPCTR